MFKIDLEAIITAFFAAGLLIGLAVAVAIAGVIWAVVLAWQTWGPTISITWGG